MGEPAIDKKAGTLAATEVTVPLPLDALTVWLGQVPVTVTLVPATMAGVAVPVPPLALQLVWLDLLHWRDVFRRVVPC